MNLEQFLRDVLPKHASPEPNNSILLLIDECANHRLVGKTTHQAVRENIAIASVALWDQLRQKSDGTFVHLTGTPIRGALPAGEEYGLPVKGYSFPDDRIIESAVVRFIMADRIVIVSENTRGNQRGLRRLLQNEVGPLLDTYHGNRFGMLAYIKKGKTSWETYAATLLVRLRSGRVNVGFEYILV